MLGAGVTDGPDQCGVDEEGFVARCSKVPIEVKNASDAISVSVGRSHSCMVIGDGTVRCWGREDHSAVSSSMPVVVEGLSTAELVVAGGIHTCVLLEDGSAACWGGNYSGELGRGGVDYALPVPAPVKGIAGVVGLMASKRVRINCSWEACGGHSCAILEDGTLHCWGNNWDGQIGLADVQFKSTPTEVPGVVGVKDVSGGDSHTCAVVDEETSTGVKCWGRGSYGQLGDGTKVEKKLPGGGVIKNLSSIKAVSAGVNHSCALKADGTVSCWGLNDQGQLGNGRAGNFATPVKVKGFKSE
ncbi:MAG: hypothetical protein HZA90_00010 [Verrucomicrobia bacterium]|nr:hypothetical protein [Verrucomicrobiota bacterium]